MQLSFQSCPQVNTAPPNQGAPSLLLAPSRSLHPPAKVQKAGTVRKRESEGAVSECEKEQSLLWQNRVLFAQQTLWPVRGCLGGKCPHCCAAGPWLQGSEGPPVGRFGETTGWRSANIAVNSTSQSPWHPAGVYLKIPDVKVTEHFVWPARAASRCQGSGY